MLMLEIASFVVKSQVECFTEFEALLGKKYSYA